MRKFPYSLLVASVLGLAATWHDAAAAATGSCYGGAVPAPPAQTQTIVVIDRTMARERDVAEAFISAAGRAASTPGQRLVVLTFSALGPDQALTKHFDRVFEAPIVDTTLIENLPIKPFKAAQRCVKAKAAEWPRLAEATIRAAVNDIGDPARFKRSEIVYSLNEVLKTFGSGGIRETRLLVLSDAYENGSLGVTMYGRNGKPRLIDARVELGRLAPEVRSRRVGNGRWDVVWFGLMSEGVGRQDRYFDVRHVQQVRAFWMQLLVRDWGVSNVVIDRIPVNAFDTPDPLPAEPRTAGPQQVAQRSLREATRPSR